jgi:hypothetical protein
MSNLTQIIGGQPYYNSNAGNRNNNLLDFWKGTQVQYDYLSESGATTATNPNAASQVTFTVPTTYFAAGQIIYVTGTSPGNVTRTAATVNSVTNATTLVVDFTTPYTSGSTTGYTIDQYLSETLYLITA